MKRTGRTKICVPPGQSSRRRKRERRRGNRQAVRPLAGQVRAASLRAAVRSSGRNGFWQEAICRRAGDVSLAVERSRAARLRGEGVTLGLAEGDSGPIE